VHHEKLQQLLPFLAGLGAGGGSSSEAAGESVTGLHFFLPMLLQCTSTAADTQAALQWRQLVSSSPELLQRLLQHLQLAVAEHGEVAAAMQGQQQQQAQAQRAHRLAGIMQQMDSAVANVSQVMVNVLDPVSTRSLGLRSHAAQPTAAAAAAAAEGSGASGAGMEKAAAAQAVAILVAWWRQVQDLVQAAQQELQQRHAQQLPVLVQAAGFLGCLQKLGITARGLLVPASLAAVLLEQLAQQQAAGHWHPSRTDGKAHCTSSRAR
jgi:hypothetical protein